MDLDAAEEESPRKERDQRLPALHSDRPARFALAAHRLYHTRITLMRNTRRRRPTDRQPRPSLLRSR